MAEKTKQSETRKPEAEKSETVHSASLVEISCPSGPRRRAGHTFGPSPTVLDSGDLSEEQRDAIHADAMLVVRPVKAAEPQPDV